MRAFEDFVVGIGETYGPIGIDREEMLAFARDFDPQPMHLDPDSEQARRMGGLLASGWYTAARNMRAMCDHFILDSTGMGSPGVASLKWLAPVRAGDRLTGRMTCIGKRASATKPDRGIVEFKFELEDPTGRPVFEQINLILFGRREPGAALPAEGERPIARPDDERFESLPSPDSAPTGPVEDLVPGTIWQLGRYDFSAERIVAFARAYDPQPFHLSEAAGRASHFGGLSASGWHIGAGWMRAVATHWHARAARGEPVPRRGPGFGFTDLVWRRPVLAGDSLTYYSRLIEARPSASKPGWGIVTQRNYALNQRGEGVFAFTGSVLWEARGG